jgi:hypothetical protein
MMRFTMETTMNEADAAVRGPDGRFLPGCSGNPAGKRPGTRNRATRLAGMMEEGEAERLVRVLVERALAGDAASARFCLGYLLVRPRGEAIRLDIPARARPGDTVAAFNATLAAMAAGEITPEEALTVTRVLQGRREALQSWREERTLTWEGDPIPGDQASREEAGWPTVPPVAEPEPEEDDDFEDDDDDDEEDYDDDDDGDRAAATLAWLEASRRKAERRRAVERRKREIAVGWPPPATAAAPRVDAAAPAPAAPSSPAAPCKSPASAGDAGADGAPAPTMRQFGAADTM